jgi:hypothetical protein
MRPRSVRILDPWVTTPVCSQDPWWTLRKAFAHHVYMWSCSVGSQCSWFKDLWDKLCRFSAFITPPLAMLRSQPACLFPHPWRSLSHVNLSGLQAHWISFSSHFIWEAAGGANSMNWKVKGQQRAIKNVIHKPFMLTVGSFKPPSNTLPMVILIWRLWTWALKSATPEI